MPEPLDIGATDLAAEAVDGRLVGRAVADSERTIAVGEAIKNPTQPGGKARGVLTHEFGSTSRRATSSPLPAILQAASQRSAAKGYPSRRDQSRVIRDADSAFTLSGRPYIGALSGRQMPYRNEVEAAPGVAGVMACTAPAGSTSTKKLRAILI